MPSGKKKTASKTAGYATAQKSIVASPCQDLILQNALTIAERLSEGMTVKEICELLNVNRETFYKVVRNNQAFANMVEGAKALYEANVTEEVKRSLVELTKDRQVETEKVLANGKVVKHKKAVTADINAIKLWLFNKDNEEFKDKQEVEITRKEIIVDIIEGADYQVLEEAEPQETAVITITEDEEQEQKD